MAGLWLMALAGAVVPPSPIDPRSWIKSEDYPKSSLALAERGYVLYRADVAPDGTVIRCDTVGASDLDRRVCTIVKYRGHFRPATGVDGKPIFGAYESIFNFALPDRRSPSRPNNAKLSLTVDRLPENLSSPTDQTVAFLVDAKGDITNCSSGVSNPARQMLTQIACTNLIEGYRPVVVRDNKGRAVDSVQHATVRFNMKGVSAP